MKNLFLVMEVLVKVMPHAYPLLIEESKYELQTAKDAELPKANSGEPAKNEKPPHSAKG